MAERMDRHASQPCRLTGLAKRLIDRTVLIGETICFAEDVFTLAHALQILKRFPGSAIKWDISCLSILGVSGLNGEHRAAQIDIRPFQRERFGADLDPGICADNDEAP